MERPPNKQIAEEIHPGNPRTFPAFEWNIYLLMIQKMEEIYSTFFNKKHEWRKSYPTKFTLRKAILAKKHKLIPNKFYHILNPIVIACNSWESSIKIVESEYDRCHGRGARKQQEDWANFVENRQNVDTFPSVSMILINVFHWQSPF